MKTFFCFDTFVYENFVEGEYSFLYFTFVNLKKNPGQIEMSFMTLEEI